MDTSQRENTINPSDGTTQDGSPTRRRKTIEEIAAEQGVRLPQDLDAMFGEGKDLWDSDEDFEEWLKGIQERRKRG